VCARERRTLLALACASLVCETKQAFCPGWSGGALGPRAPLRARPRAQAGALSLECGFRDQLRKLNPFSQQSKSERLRRQWAERSNAVDVPGLEPSAPDASETKTPPSASTPANKSRLQDLLKPGTGTTKLQQELAAREAERMRAWSTPVPTKTAKLIFESAGGEESAEDRRKRQEAAAKDMERVLGRKLLQQRAQEAAQPELDEAERREIAVRLVGRDIAVQSRCCACACACSRGRRTEAGLLQYCKCVHPDTGTSDDGCGHRRARRTCKPTWTGRLAYARGNRSSTCPRSKGSRCPCSRSQALRAWAVDLLPRFR
jgi:hypothetical protein